MKVLVAGWFSFEHGHATAGDLLAKDLACDWIQSAGHSCDVALAPPFSGGVDLSSVDPAHYFCVVFVCGPFERGKLEAEFLVRFGKCRLIGLDLSMLVPLDAWNPFDYLIERDSSAAAHPDIVFLSNQKKVPVVGICLVEPYPAGLTDAANAAIRRLIASREAAVIEIDTRLDTNSTGLRSAAEIESLIARVDVLVTTRLHGLVLALKNGIPVLAIDPEAGGAKIKRQAETIEWPVVFTVDALSDDSLSEAFEYCLTHEARLEAAACRDRASGMVRAIRDEFIAALTHPERWQSRHIERTSARRNAPINAPADSQTDTPQSTAGQLLKRTEQFGKSIYREAASALSAAARDKLTRWRKRSDTQPAPVQFGDLRRTTPFSVYFGYDRGLPVDRYYIEQFLVRNAEFVRGRVLEIGDDTYTRRFGGDRVTQRDVLHVHGGNPSATFVGDLTNADQIPSDTFDCLIVTQTLHLIYDVRAAIRALHRILRPGGTLLATVPGITQISDDEWAASWYWAFTTLSVRRLFADVFPGNRTIIEAHGNVLAATAFLQGLATEELQPSELDVRDPHYQLVIAVKATKPE